MDLTIDNRRIEARHGEKVLQAALRHGIEIPHFCFHASLSIAGNCRMCLIKLEGVSKLMPACNLNVTANMKVLTSAPEVLRARHDVMRFLMLNHPVDCGICDKAGECRLQDYEFMFGPSRSESSEPKLHKRKLHQLTPRVQLDNERCILCSRCVRFTREVSKTSLLGIVGRGNKAFVDRMMPDSIDDPYFDNVIGLCPTGALLSQDFLYKSRVWFLEPVRSVCTGCSRVCSVNLWRRKKQWQMRALGDDANRMVYRVTACENPQINGPWICNKGFDLPKWVGRDRVLTSMLAGAPATVSDALAAARHLLATSKSPAAFVSAQGSNEELDAFAAFAGTRIKVYVRQDCTPMPGEVVQDGLLIRADKNPNTFGVQSRFGATRFVAANALEHDLFLIWGRWDDDVSLGSTPLIHLSCFAKAGNREPDVYVPLSTTFERSGSFFNFEGKLNRFEKVFDPPGQVQHAADVFEKLGQVQHAADVFERLGA